MIQHFQERGTRNERDSLNLFISPKQIQTAICRTGTSPSPSSALDLFFDVGAIMVSQNAAEVHICSTLAQLHTHNVPNQAQQRPGTDQVTRNIHNIHSLCRADNRIRIQNFDQYNNPKRVKSGTRTTLITGQNGGRPVPCSLHLSLTFSPWLSRKKVGQHSTSLLQKCSVRTESFQTSPGPCSGRMTQSLLRHNGTTGGSLKDSSCPSSSTANPLRKVSMSYLFHPRRSTASCIWAMP